MNKEKTSISGLVPEIKQDWVSNAACSIVTNVEEWQHCEVRLAQIEAIIRKYAPNTGDQEVKIPNQIASLGFIQAHKEWMSYLRSKRRSKISDATIKKHMKQFEAWGTDHSIAIINQSIERGWSGLFPVKDFEKSKPEIKKPSQNWKEHIGLYVIGIELEGKWPADKESFSKALSKSIFEAPNGTQDVRVYLKNSGIDPMGVELYTGIHLHD